VSFVPTTKSRALFGLLNLSCYARTFSATSDTAALDVTTMCKTAREFIPGQTSGSASIDGPLDTDATSNGFVDAIHDLKQSSAPFTYGPEGITAGSAALMGLALQTNITTQSSVTGTVDYSAAMDISGGLEAGAFVEAEGTLTADTTGAAQNNGAASSNGGIAHLHVSAFSGFTSDAITIEHSVNGSTSWATLVTFSTVTAVGSEQVVVAPGTTVRQYLRVVDDVTGSGSITRTVAFARR
jgi:hypothetical protein